MKCVQTLEGHLDKVWHVSWEPTEGKHLASCSADKTIRLWKYDSESGTCSPVCVLQGAHTRTVRSSAWAPGGKKLGIAFSVLIAFLACFKQF